MHKGSGKPGDGGCGSGCPSVLFNIRNLPGGTTWSVDCHSDNFGTVNSAYGLTTSASGDSFSWNGYCVFGSNVGNVWVVLSRGGVSHSSPHIFWS